MLGTMCGIAGSWSRVGSDADGQRLARGLETIRHRGPDDLGVFHWHDPASSDRVDLGLVRLAILDLSAAGHQPMSLPGGRFTISFNGEITNYVELREELSRQGERFASETDTEVLLRAWARWGTAALARLEGMYAVAVLDTQARTLTLARDPYGVKPLFYSADQQRLVFNSELPGLLAAIGTTPRLDWQAATDYLQWSAYDHNERTFVDGVHQLAPGHYLVMDIGRGTIGEPIRFWTPPIATTFSGSFAAAAESVRELFLDSVRRNLQSDVPVGIALSGGLDSSAIVGAVRHLDRKAPIETFSFVSPGFAESEHEWVALVADATGARSHTVTAARDDLEHDLDDLIMSQGEPFGSTSIYAQYRVFRLAREHGIVVTLDGQGGDELFAGYHGYAPQRMHSLLERGRVTEAVRFANRWGHWPGRSAARLWPQALGQFLPASRQGAILKPRRSPMLDARALHERGIDLSFPAVRPVRAPGARVKSYLQAALTRHGLPALLRHGDRNSMRFAIESRVPFLDRRLTEHALSLPEDWLIGRDGTSKRILREAMRGIVPDAVVDRRDKIGFSTPQQGWLERLCAAPVDMEHPIGLLSQGLDGTVAGGYSQAELRWGSGGPWRLVNLRRWVSLMGIDAT